MNLTTALVTLLSIQMFIVSLAFLQRGTRTALSIARPRLAESTLSSMKMSTHGMYMHVCTYVCIMCIRLGLELWLGLGIFIPAIAMGLPDPISTVRVNDWLGAQSLFLGRTITQ